MRHLLDTCAFLWLAQQPSKISPSAASAINAPDCELFLSEVSILEIVMKHSSGKLPLPGVPRDWIPEKLSFHQIQSNPLTPEIIYRSGDLPKVHTDPFDRLIAAHALEEGFTILSPDVPLYLLGASRIW